MCAPRAGGVSRDFKERSRSRARACRVARWPLNFAPGHAWKWNQRGKVRRSLPGDHRTPHEERADGSFATSACALDCRSRVAREPAEASRASPYPPGFRTRRQRDPPPDSQDERTALGTTSRSWVAYAVGMSGSERPEGLLPSWDDSVDAAGPMPAPPGTFGLRILGVSEVTKAVRDAIRAHEGLRDVWVEGEVGRVTVSSGRCRVARPA